MLTHFRKLSLLTFGLSYLLVTSAQAQSMQWGTGMSMGMQGCGYQQKAGMGATSESDAVSELVQEQKQLKQTLQDKQRKQKTLERELEKLHDTISDSLNGDISEFAFSHMENGNRCDDYQTSVTIAPVKSKVKVDEEGQDLPPADEPMVRSSGNQNKLPLNGMSVAGLARYCDTTRAGTLRADLCSDVRYRSSDNKRGDSACKKAIPDYRKKYVESQKIADEIERTKQKLEDLKTDIADARKEAREDRQNGNTEGDVCLECIAKDSGYQSEQRQNQTDWSGVAANVGTGLLAMYMGYKQNKMVAEYNSDLGWPTQSYPTWGYGLPYMAAGLYGAMGGGTGQGAFGCGSSGGQYGNMNGGALGYPSNMYGSPMGGGMYSTGSGPWGMSGMNMGGMNGGMYGGMMMSGGLMASSYPNYGMMGSGMMNSGMMVSGGLGLMSNGMMSGGYSLMSNGTMASGYMGMGLMGTGSMSMDSSTMQMYQSYLQQQQQYLQSYQARAQTMTGLQSELSNLLYRINQVQYGNYYGTGTTSSSSYLSGTTAYTSSPYIPIPASSTSTYYNSGVIPASTSSGSVVIPASSR